MKPLTSHFKSLSFFALAVLTCPFLSAEPVPDAIGKMFDQSCKDCHHPDGDDEPPYLHSKVTIESLLDEEAIVSRATPRIRPLYARVMLEEGSRKRMPRSKGQKGDKSFREPLSDSEKTLLANWIAGLKDSAPAPVQALASAVPVPVPVKSADVNAQPREATVVAASVIDDVLPEGDLELRARHILGNHCQRCHNPEKRTSPDLRASLFEMVKNGDSQEILARIHLPVSDDNTMPPEPERRLTTEEKSVLINWFSSNQEKKSMRKPIYYTETVREIYEDVMENDRSARYFRYFTLTNLYNALNPEGEPLHSDMSMDTFRVGVSKLINSLSLHGSISVPVPIDEMKTIYRIDLRDYKWSPQDWERVVNYYPHGIIGIDAQKEKIISQRTESRMAYLRADWFTFAASQPPLYDDILEYLLGIYSTDDKNVQDRLEHRIGVDRVANIQGGHAVRAGLLKSGVSDHNRLLERHESDYGAYWVSYDFKRVGGGARQDLRKAPLGPPEAHIAKYDEHVFEHDGGEMIWALPNGMQAYLLATSKGTRLDRAPNEIVRDRNRPDGTIINGISCIKCHDRGMKGAIKAPYPEGVMEWDEEKMGAPNPRSPAGMTDEIRPFVEGSRILGGREMGIFQKLYVEKEELRRLIMLDYERFNAANDQATGKFVSAVEPVSALYDSYYLEPVNAHLLAAEFGMDFNEMMSLLKEESFKSESFRTLFHALESGAAEARDQMLQEFLTIVYILGYQLMPFEPLGYEEFGGAEFAELIRQSPAYVASFGSGHFTKQDYDDVRKDYSKIKKAVTQSKAALERQSSSTVLLPGGGKMKVSVEPVIKMGTLGHLKVSANRSIYIHVLHRGSGTDVTQFFPNAKLTNNRLISHGGVEVTKTITFQTSPPAGAEFFEIYASSAPIHVRTEGKKIGDFTAFEKDTFFNARGIATALAATDSTKKKSDIPDGLTKVTVGYLLKH